MASPWDFCNFLNLSLVLLANILGLELTIALEQTLAWSLLYGHRGKSGFCLPRTATLSFLLLRRNQVDLWRPFVSERRGVVGTFRSCAVGVRLFVF